MVFRPRNARDAEIRRQIETKQEKLRAVNRTTAVIGDLKNEIAALEQAIEFFRSKLPSDKEIDKVLRELWHIAEKNQLTTKSVRTLPRTPENMLTSGGPHSEQPISMQLEGDFAGFYGFLQAVECQPRIMRIRSMTLGKPPKGAEGAVQATLVMSIFFEPSGKEG